MPKSSTASQPAAAFRRVTTLKHLTTIFEDRIEKSQVRGRDGVSADAVSRDLATIVRFVSEQCRAGTYRFTSYRQRLFLKGAGRPPREISIPTVRDRIALRAIADLLIELFPDSTGKLPQTGVAEAMEALSKGVYDTYIRIDVKDFYPSVDHDILISQLAKRIQKPEILRVVRRAIATPTAPDGAARPRSLLKSGVPQGLSISNLLAEFYMRPIDQLLESVVNVSYHRFVDDILILCMAADAESVDAQCRAALLSLKLEAHTKAAGGKSEVGLIADGFTYLGYQMSTNHISVRHASIIRLESRIASIHAQWRQDISRGISPLLAGQRFAWQRNIAITGCIFEGVANGWIQYFRQLDDLSLLKRLDATVDRLSTRYGTPTTPPKKTFVRAYWAVKHPRSRNQSYIPNYDLFDVGDMRNELDAMGTASKSLSDDEVKDAFFRVVRKAVRDLEHDIGNIS